MIQQHPSAIPRLATAPAGPLGEPERLFPAGQGEIKRWFRSRWLQPPAPFYTSVDPGKPGFVPAQAGTRLIPAGLGDPSPDLDPRPCRARSRREPGCAGVTFRAAGLAPGAGRRYRSNCNRAQDSAARLTDTVACRFRPPPAWMTR